MTVLAADNLFGKEVSVDKEKTVIQVEAAKFSKDESQGIERALKFTDAVDVAMAKMLRKGSTFVNERDHAAIEDFGKNIDYYLAVNMALAERVKRYYKDHKLTMKDADEWDIMHDEIKNVTMQ